MLMATTCWGGCHGFSTRGQVVSEVRVGSLAGITATSRRNIRAALAVTNDAEEPETTESSNSSICFNKRHIDADLHQYQQHRRRFVSGLLSSASSLVMVSAFGSTNNARAESDTPSAPTSTRIIRLSSGLQFGDQRVGSGPIIQIPKINPSPDTSSNNDDGLEPDDPSIVLMHLKALRRDGSVLLDTYEDNKPLLFKLGSIPSEIYYLNEAGAMSKGKIPLGVQDAILAQGSASWEGGFGKADPMRAGGIRKVIVPPELAYGTKGVSRYEAFQLGLKQPVARNELLRYEIELLRCNDEVFDLAGSDGELGKDDGSKVSSTATAARACCPQELYPCKLGG
jgi:hypothetical protein